MTHTYAAKRLLEHGPLTFADFFAITGWPKRSAHMALEQLRRAELVVMYRETGTRRNLYRLA